MPDGDGKNRISASKKHTYQAIRSYKIIKSNELIQKSKYELSAQEQKIILYLISKVKPDDETFITTEFDIIEFCCVCGIDIKAGKNRKDIISAIKEVADRSIWVRLENNKITTLRWIDKPVIDELTGMMQVKLDDLLKPFLTKLKNNFTQFELIYTLAMKSKYSIRLYEILKATSIKNRLCSASMS